MLWASRTCEGTVSLWNMFHLVSTLWPRWGTHYCNTDSCARKVKQCSRGHHVEEPSQLHVHVCAAYASREPTYPSCCYYITVCKICAKWACRYLSLGIARGAGRTACSCQCPGHRTVCLTHLSLRAITDIRFYLFDALSDIVITKCLCGHYISSPLSFLKTKKVGGFWSSWCVRLSCVPISIWISWPIFAKPNMSLSHLSTSKRGTF
jgi:hypothetical protein